jgi:transcriptional regulator with XRE-family HTH domain
VAHDAVHAETLTILKDLAEVRRAQAISQGELASRSGLDQAQLSRIEAERVDPRLSSLVQIARALGQEIVLVPQGSLSAVRAVIRSSAPQASVSPLARQTRQLLTIIESRLERLFHDASSLEAQEAQIELRKSLQDLRHLAPQRLSTQILPLQHLQRSIAAQIRQGKPPKEKHWQRLVTKVREIYQAAATAPAQNEPQSRMRPAWALEDDSANT